MKFRYLHRSTRQATVDLTLPRRIINHYYLSLCVGDQSLSINVLIR